MLLELHVENLLLIEQAKLSLSAGLNVLTGETGAGKTVLAHALDLLLGGRARTGIVRPGAAEAYVEGVFALPETPAPALLERLPEDAQEIVLARRVGADGRTRAYLNGRSATVGELRDLGASLVSFYGQHEHRKLTIAGAQLRLLDELCGSEQAAHLRGCAEVFEQTGRLRERLGQLRELASTRERELELLEFELAEIDDAAPEQHEHDELLGARERLRRQDALRGAAAAGVETLVGDSTETPGVAALLAGAVGHVDALSGVDPHLDALAERLRALAIESQDLAGELRDYIEGSAQLDGEQITLDGVEQRLAAIERLVRKHGGSVEAVLAYADRARARREELIGAEVALGETSEQLSEAEAALQAHVTALRAAREAVAPSLQRAVAEQLASLAMDDAHFEVQLDEREVGLTGGDSVEFLIAPNRGVPAGPLREIASGGELSRVMLAIMSVANAPSPDNTLVFDEVDAGIGGHTARAVGARLRELGESRQVLCITHLPQIASLGDRHFSIVKDASGRLASAQVVELAEKEVVSELVRMLGADDADAAARRHARDLRRAA